MQAWVVLNINGEPAGIRETSEEVTQAALQAGRESILENDERKPEHAEGLVAVPEFDGDRVLVKVYIKDERELPYIVVEAWLFDSTAPVSY